MPIMDIAKRTVSGALRMVMEIVAGTIGGAIGIVLFVGVGLVRICAAIVSGIGFLGMVFWGAAWILLNPNVPDARTPRRIVQTGCSSTNLKKIAPQAWRITFIAFSRAAFAKTS